MAEETAAHDRAEMAPSSIRRDMYTHIPPLTRLVSL
jgi:hypothetical protein